MPKKRESDKQTSIRVEQFSDGSGNLNISSKNITTHQTITDLSGAEAEQLFNQLYAVIFKVKQK